jgi:hypothetical protein
MDGQDQRSVHSLSSGKSSRSSSESRSRRTHESDRSSLNKRNDGFLRHAESFSEALNSKSNHGPASVEDGENKIKFGKASHPSEVPERFRTVSSDDGNSNPRHMAMSPCTTENLRRLREVTSRSISRSRLRKEAAEEKFKCLMTAATRSDSFDDNSTLFRARGRIGSTDESSQKHLPPRVNRNVFGSTAHVENDENNLVRPMARKARPPSRGNPQTFMEIQNNGFLGDSNSVSSVKENSEKEHYSQQMNITVMDNFYMFKI